MQQSPPVFTTSPRDNNQSFRFPPAPINDTPLSYSSNDVNDDMMIDDTPNWLGGPLTDEVLSQSQDQKDQQKHHHQRQSSAMESMLFDQEREKMMQYESMMPYRRHSLAHHESLLQHKTSTATSSLLSSSGGPWLSEKRASFSSAASFSSQIDPFGVWSPKKMPSLWESNTSNNNNNNYSTSPAPTSSSSSCSPPSPPGIVSSTSPSSSLFQQPPSSQFSQYRFPLAGGMDHCAPPPPSADMRLGRRLSLAPPNTTTPNQDMMHYAKSRDMLSSVPEEPGLLPYRRHSLAGPLLGVSRNLDEQRQQQRQLDKFLPSNLLTSDTIMEGEATGTIGHHHHHQQGDMWCMVEFKAGRSEIYCSSIPVEKDDWVIVEADRGRDLGKVVARDLPVDQVVLLMQQQQASSWDHSQSDNANNGTNAPPSTPKRIVRLASAAEITLLVTKRQDEQKALLICQTKSKQKKLMMDIVDAEYQWDRRKLTFYFVAERRVDFRELVRDLFRIYKTRIWMCSVNTVGKKPPM